MTTKTKTDVVVAEEPTMASGIEQEAAAPVNETPKPMKAKRAKAIDITLEELCARYIAHLDESGKSQGTLFRHKLELTTALDELAKDTPLSTLTPARVLEYFTCDRVMKTRTGVAKARPKIAASAALVSRLSGRSGLGRARAVAGGCGVVLIRRSPTRTVLSVR